MGERTRLWSLICALILLPVTALAAEPRVEPAVDGVMRAFQTHPLVAIGDAHVMAEEGAFWAALVRDPRFAREVGNVAVEFGGAAHQDIVDRYVAGETVPYAELRKVWTDVVGFVPTVNRKEYVDFFAAVRAVNLGLPPDRRIKVWLGQPPIDWSEVRTREALHPMSVGRDRYPIDLIEREILAKGKKALLIWGALHFRSQASGLDPVLGDEIERAYPGSLFLAIPYYGFNEPACGAAFEARTSGWPAAALVTPVQDTWVRAALHRAGCTHQPALAGGAPGVPANALASLKAADDADGGARADGLLYFGKGASLTVSPVDPAFYMDEAYFREISRRNEIMTGKPLDWAATVAGAASGVENFDAHLGRRAATKAQDQRRQEAQRP